MNENQIVVYQPNETVRLDVRLENETVWLTQSQMATLFGCSTDNIGLHLKNVYSVGELSREATTEDFSVVRLEGSRQVRRTVTCYNLDAIISVGYRVNSVLGVKFRQWATGILKEYLLRGYSVNARLNQLEDKVDRRLVAHDQRISTLESKVDFFVQTKEPPLQGVFYDGQLWDARALVLKLVAGAKRSLILIDNWATTATLDLFAKKRKGVKVTVFTSQHFNKKGVPQRKLSASDVATFNAQYPKLAVRFTESFHDRFLVIDDRELYLIGASLKDLGRKCFAFTKLDPGEIVRIRAD
ncbi:MAG: virulence RhuM family protein [Kiritimatiellae bacterium]|nr:virulence RhuM family protein [Kiritimatiellia bacterium]